MQGKQLIDKIEQIARVRGVETPDRWTLLSWIADDLEEIISSRDWNWAKRWLDPIVNTAVGTREYPLPDDFGVNFCIYRDSADSGGGVVVDATSIPTSRYAVHIYDGTSQYDLIYRPPDEFYSQKLKAESNALPRYYTIMRNAAGPYISLSPPPDLTTYTVLGLYKPATWNLNEMSEIPPMPHDHILIYGALKLLPGLQGEFGAQYDSAFKTLCMEDAREHKVQIRPRLGYARNEYTLIRRP